PVALPIYVGDDVLAVELGERQLDRFRAGGEDHVPALELDLAAVVLLHLDHAVRMQGGEAVVRRHLVGLEQHGDAAGELLNDAVLAGDRKSKRLNSIPVKISYADVSWKQ